MKSVLIIEDDTDLQRIYHDRLVGEGYEVRQATTGQQGVSLAQQKKPDIILLDVMMPGGMNGFDVLEQFKRDLELQNVPVIMSTNLDSEGQTARSIGVADYVVKANVTPEQMIEKIKAILPQ